MAERNTDVTTFSKTFQEKQKTFPCDPQDLFQIALLYIDFQTNDRDYKEDLLVIALLAFDILIAIDLQPFLAYFQFSKNKILPQNSGKLTYNLFWCHFSVIEN